MAETSIEWTNRVWNPVTGCTKVGAGCLNCYAETVDRRFHQRLYKEPFIPWTVKAQGEAGQPSVMLHPERLEQPLHWKKPSRIFVNSMSDLFHEDVPDEFLPRVFAVMAAAQHHTFQVLTKRPERMKDVLNDGIFWEAVEQVARHEYGKSLDAWLIAYEPLPNLWLGVSVENQKAADDRILWLLQTPAAVRFLSLEPLLSSVDIVEWPRLPSFGYHNFSFHLCHGNQKSSIHWAIIGGESGPVSKARRMDPAWALNLIEQCRAAGVPVFVKQMGSVLAREWGLKNSKGGDMSEWPPEFQVREFPEPGLKEE